MGRRIRDLTGERFWYLVALRPTEERSCNSVVWLCRCDCGREHRVSSAHLIHGDAQTCEHCRPKLLRPGRLPHQGR